MKYRPSRLNAAMIFGWMCVSAVLPKVRTLEDLVPVNLIRVSADEPTDSWHGRAIVYHSIPKVKHIVADIIDPLWFETQPMGEFAFRVDRPEKLNRIKDSALKRLAGQFEQYGYRVKELHVHVGGVTIIHFVG